MPPGDGRHRAGAARGLTATRMDLPLYGRVLWRHRAIVVAGILLAFALAFLSMFKVGWADGSPKVDYRKPVTYQSQATIFVTQRGYPWGAASSIAAHGPAGRVYLGICRPWPARLPRVGVRAARDK